MELNEKYMLTVKEASEYYNIGTKALRRVEESCPDCTAIPVFGYRNS